MKRNASLALGTILVLGGFAACAGEGGSTEHGPIFADAGISDAGPIGEGQADQVTGDVHLPADSRAPGSEASIDSGARVDSGVDSGGADTSSGTDAAGCTSTVAVVGGGATTAFGATSHGGTWTVASLSGSAASTPAVVALSTGFQAVFRVGTTNALEYSTYGSAWSSLAPIAAASTIDIPALAIVGADLHLVYRGTDSKFYHGTFSGSSWDQANDPVGGSAAQSFGPSAPSAAGAGGELVIAQDGSNGFLYDQTWSSSWMPGSEHANALVSTVAPTVVLTNGGSFDLFVVFVHQTDDKLYWTGRVAGNWTTPALIDPNAYTSFPVALAPLPGGQVVMLFEGSDMTPYFSVFNPTVPSWTTPSALVAGTNPQIPSPPAVAAGVCGHDAIAVYAGASGVEVVTLNAGAWSTPAPIAGTTGVTYAAVATSP